MTTLDIVFIGVIWVTYGVFNAKQHSWHEEQEDGTGISGVMVTLNVIFAPVALLIRFWRGVFLWEGKY